MSSALRRSYNENRNEDVLTPFSLALTCSIKAKGAEPYLASESPKLISRKSAISTTTKWVNEMGGEPARK
ncbi:uncharacterized protein ACA1_057270 [Acanthamoeba castellanii str. Neff]|uniref:Uncharacterized protein n=1 Tax=Acanthamoeba castellanii (strain ATCC 30010 / Neff) TaxID=1257118 RepID=L8GX25_ACACF|nr:uncharacterized protein ACA1_057270 [Acanthamoeba castellanii str. Neff]ELR17093.1 hypothetical protein ACA1_057270 [Acanthamoeba castellanii str. Neff]